MAKGINKLQFVIFVVFFLFFTGNSYSQLQFSTSYEFSGDIKTDIENNTTDYGIKVQIGAANYSNSGYFRKAQELFGSRPLSEKSLALFSPDDWESTDARRYILKRSKNERIIVINEAHNNSRHRNFTASLLEGLYKNGYRYLGLEALWVDSIVNQRKFVVWEDGFYTREPEFGNLITEAIRLGFTVFGYEADNKNGEEREQEQVRNIMCYLPGIDCGACGSPNCQSLAEDIIRRTAKFSDCVFMQRNMEKHGKLDYEHAIRIVEETWGKDRLNKDCYKKGAKYEGL